MSQQLCNSEKTLQTMYFIMYTPVLAKWSNFFYVIQKSYQLSNLKTRPERI